MKNDAWMVDKFRASDVVVAAAVSSSDDQIVLTNTLSVCKI